MNDEERSPRSRQDPRRDGEPPSSRSPISTGETPRPPPPASSRTAERVPPSSRLPGSARNDELAGLYRKIADLQAELSDAEVRLERARAESASADEMVGQMLARVAEVEARLRHAEDAGGEALGRAERAEEEATTLRDQLGHTRLEISALEAELAAARHDTEAARADTDARCAELEALEGKLLREQEERGTLSLRVIEFAKVCEERDGALLREELLEAELNATRGAQSGQLRAGQTAEMVEALAREEEAAGRVGPARELEVVRAERDALAFEVRHLRMAIERVGGALGDLDHALRSQSVPAPRPSDRPTIEAPTLVAVTSAEEPIAVLPATGVSTEAAADTGPLTPRALPSLMDDEDLDATKVFGKNELGELVRRTARTSEPGGSSI